MKTGADAHPRLASALRPLARSAAAFAAASVNIPSRPAPGRLLGRETDVTMVLDRVTKAGEDIVVLAPPGMGASAIISEVANRRALRLRLRGPARPRGLCTAAALRRARAALHSTPPPVVTPSVTHPSPHFPGSRFSRRALLKREFPGGIYYTDLAGVESREAAAVALALTVNAPRAVAEKDVDAAVVAALRHIGEDKLTLIVFDSAESFVESSPGGGHDLTGFVSKLHSVGPNVRFLIATSHPVRGEPSRSGCRAAIETATRSLTGPLPTSARGAVPLRRLWRRAHRAAALARPHQGVPGTPQREDLSPLTAPLRRGGRFL